MAMLTVAEQREAIYTLLTDQVSFDVIKYPRDDPIPPAAMILNPRFTFPDNSKLGVIEWSIRLYEVRKAPASVGEGFDALLPPILLELGRGMKMGYVLERVENQILTDMGYPIPGYVIVGNVPYGNC